MSHMNRIFFVSLCVCLFSCKEKESNTSSAAAPVAVIESLDESFHQIIHDTARVQIIAEGCEWSEGPLWLNNYGTLLFSDNNMGNRFTSNLPAIRARISEVGKPDQTVCCLTPAAD
jgi:hypothetical protein